MTEYSTLTTCRDITDDMINEAVESRDGMRALFERAVEIAQPRQAGSRVLLLFAKMASPACDWLEGALRVELRAEGDNTVITSVVEIGGGLKERVFHKRTIAVPLVEFEAAIKKFPQAIVPLTAEVSRGKLVLTAPEAEKVLEDEAPAKPIVRAPDVADLPTIGLAHAATAPFVSKPALQPIASRPLAKLQLRKSPIGRGVTEVSGPSKKEKKRPKSSRPPAKRASSKPPPQNVKPKEDVDKGWDE